MRLAEDHRARVPFALVGVLLLVGSAGLSATFVDGPGPRTDQSVGAAIDRTTAATNTALRGAVARAGVEAAREPVIEPANTTAGSVLNDSTPYRDYLRVRIYLAARRALDSVAVRVGGVRGSVSLPPVSNASALREAKRRVEIESAGRADSAGLRVRIRNVTVVATREGRAVEQAELSPTLVVGTPALALHERAERFESRLNRGPLAPGLGRRLTARLYPVAWARGYAQYGGAPIDNVVANRHVELAANGAALREQRVAFGRSDPAGRRALAWATARVGATDLLVGADNQRGTRRTELLLAAADRYKTENPMPDGVTADDGAGEGAQNGERPDLRVGVNRTADRAFADLVVGANGTDLDGILRSAYSVDARLVAAVREVESEPWPSPKSPGENWTLSETRVRTTTRTERASGPQPVPPRGWHLLRTETRRVVRTHALVAEWVNGNQTRRTVRRWSETFAVGLGVAGDHSAERVPPRPVAGVHERGGALDGPNLWDAESTAVERLVAGRGGFGALARRAVAGTLDTRPREVAGRRPPELRPWVYRDVAALRERVRNVSVASSPGSTLSGRPPAAELARELRSRRAALLATPSRYDGVADRARVAARAAYLDRVLARLDARAERANATRKGVDGALSEAGVSLDRVRQILEARAEAGTPPPKPMPADGPGAAANLSVVGAPPYLTLAELDREQVAAIPEGESRHPLAARNHNVFAAPYGDAADAVASALSEESGASGQADLRTAALALRAANRTLEARENRTLERRRDALRAALAESMAEIRRALVAELALSRFDLGAAERRAAVSSGLARWDTTAGRALAVANGSAAGPIAVELLRRGSGERESSRRKSPRRESVRRDWVRLRVGMALESARRGVEGPPGSLVNRSATTTRRLARDAAKSALEDGLKNATEAVSERWFGEVLGTVPAGLPVAPVPGHWYATVNVWRVSVRGEYARFAVRAPQGTPGESVVYEREAGEVRLNFDGDGEREVLGRTTPVSFETGTVVVVVVPPGPPGVGDRGGDADERSADW